MSDEHNLNDLQARIAKGAGLIGAARLAIRCLGVINTIIVARLLAPEDFGLIAIAVATMQLLQGFSEIGVSQAVIRFRDATKDDHDTLFTFSVARGALVALVLCLLAPFAAQWYHDPRVSAVFFGIALYPLCLGLINPRFYEFERDLDFSRDFIVTTANKMISVIVSISIALIWRNYWAIILGLVASGVTQLLLSYVMRPYRPRFSLASANKLLSFSGWLTGLSFVVAINNKMDSLILARLLGPAATGRFYLGQQLAELPSAELATTLARAIYPGLTSLHGKAEEMRRAYLKGVEALAIFVLPVGFGFGFVAHDLVPLLLGQKWIEAIPVIAILAPIISIQTIMHGTRDYAMANDLTKAAFYRECLFLTFRLPMFIFATYHYGLMGAVISFAIADLVHLLIELSLYQRVSGRSFLDPLIAARRSFAAAFAMAGYFLLVRPDLPLFDTMPTVLSLFCDVAIGGVIFLTVQYGLWRLAGAPNTVERTLLQLLPRPI